MIPWFRAQASLTPDGKRYIYAAEGKKVSRPFHYRWLLPKLLGVWARKWTITQDVCALVLPVLGFWYAGGGWAGVFVGAMAIGLTGVIYFNRKNPVLVDLPAMTVGLAAADCWRSGWWLPALALIIVAATIKETTPVFAAAWAWTPWLLVGLLAPAARHFVRRHECAVDAPHEPQMRDVVRSAFAYRAEHGVQRFVYVLPWGVCLIGLAHFSPQLAVTLALAYGQLVIATDVVRLYEWGWPVLALAAAGAVDPVWYPMLIALHWCNPFASEGS